MTYPQKKILFFDGDGTLWYPKKTRHTKKPHWVYALPGTLTEKYKQLVLIPGVLATLKKLKKRGLILILLSTHPHPPTEAASIITHKVKHFKLDKIFDEIHATREFPASKGKFILAILKKYGLPKNSALMIGDHYRWDYKPARDVGVDALLLESTYMKNDVQGKRVKNILKKFSDLIQILG